MALGIFALLVNAALQAIRLYFDRKDRGRIVDAASCNMTPRLVERLQEAFTSQQVYGSKAEDFHDTQRADLGKLISALERLTEKLIVSLDRNDRMQTDLQRRGGRES